MLKLKDIDRALEELPLLPTVVSQLLVISPNDEEYYEKVLTLAKQDPPFALRIIRVSNSSANAPVSPIISLEAAVARLGVRQIAGMITSMAVTRVFSPSTEGERNLWVHAVQVAVAARTIARETPALKVDPEQAYLCGLLHDIGRFVLFEKATEALKNVDEHNWKTPTQLVEIELETYGFDHAELGSRVCKNWGLPEAMSTVVANHHAYELSPTVANDIRLANLIHVIQVADFLSVFMMLNPEFLELKESQLDGELDEKCISPSCLESPVSATTLRKHAENIFDESNEIISHLGIINCQ